ncbi:MAG: LysR family transcriptional regulator [Solobacterium sp.]|nr:LysR family transcriptional regulator [Solobacterium sp.]
MEFRSLRYFAAVAKELNMTSAAAVLNVSQPALSYQIAELEKEMGCLLFERAGRKLRLTAKGETLLHRAEEILELADRIPYELSESDETISGDVFIGAAESPGMHMIADAIYSLRQKYPDIRFHFYSGNLDDVYERVRSGILDFAVMLEPFSFDHCETITLPYSDRLGFLLRRDHPLASKSKITSNDLIGLPLLLSSRPSLSYEYYAQLFSISQDLLNVAGTGNLIYNKSILAEHGIGAAFSLEGLVHCDDSSPLVFLPFEPELRVRLVFAWKQYRPLSRASAAFLEEIKKMRSHTETR